MQYCAPIRAQVKRRDDVSKQKEREPPEHVRQCDITKPDRRPGDESGERDYPKMRADSGEKLHRVSHSYEIGADVDGIGEEERTCYHRQNGSRKLRMKRRCTA